MNDKQKALIKTIAILLSVTREAALGKMLNLCLVAKVDPQGYNGMSALQMAEMTINDGYDDMLGWLDEMIFSDYEISDQEDEAFQQCWESPDMFADFMLMELENINWTEMSGQLDDIQQALITAMTILLSVNLETSLGKLLKLCLEAKVSQETGGKNPFEMATEIMDVKDEGMYGIYDWLEGVVFTDNNISREEGEAFNQCLESLDGFSNFVDQELGLINI